MTAFEEMYRTGKPTVSSYIMRSGERRVVYSAPIAPVEIDGTTYTSLAVSYRNKTIEELIGGVLTAARATATSSIPMAM